MDGENKNKYDQLMHLLEAGDAMVCLDARLPEVEVPQQHKTDSALRLVFNLNFRRPIEVTEEGIFATLSFGGRPHRCVIPFEAIWAIFEPGSENGQVWESSLPSDIDLVDEILSKSSEEKKSSKPVKKPPTKPKSSSTKRDRSHLRVIK